jgi:hypothetical protein
MLVLKYSYFYLSEQPALFSCKAHIFQVDPDTRKSWLPLSNSAGM